MINLIISYKGNNNMAIGTPSQSPAIVIKEVDLSGIVPNVQSTTGAIVGGFRWGPVETRVKRISNETELAATFGITR